MALIKYGGGIVQMSGSIAGNTHARNRFGNYMRARTKPVNPNTARQVTARSRLALLAEDWREVLSDAQRIAWNTYAAGVSWLNGLGEVVHLTGFNMFCRTNAAYMQVSSRQNTAPVILSTEGGAGMLISIGDPQNPTRSFFGGPWRYHGWIGGTIPGPTSSPDGPTAVDCFTLSEGARVWVKANIIRADGRLSTPFEAPSVLVGA